MDTPPCSTCKQARTAIGRVRLIPAWHLLVGVRSAGRQCRSLRLRPYDIFNTNRSLSRGKWGLSLQVEHLEDDGVLRVHPVLRLLEDDGVGRLAHLVRALAPALRGEAVQELALSGFAATG
jgi:hypothetical protein